MKLLLVEDNPAMQTTLQRSLQRRGMQVVVCGDGARALDRWRASVPDVVLLDLSLPGEDGLSILAAARAEGLQTPVIIVTARGTVGDRVLGLNTGADDYLLKPFDLDELEARVQAVLRRRQPPAGAAAPRRSDFAGLSVDDDSGAVYLDGQALELSTRESALLRALLARPGQAVGKERLSELVFPGQAEVAADAIEVVVYRLRRKIKAAAVELVTLRGLGYLLRRSA
ncbi:MAG: response regulator transcription factor [Proteobacteria bacterium]|nr:response regulator transcription factor [Pseudomonadota bacterium]